MGWDWGWPVKWCRSFDYTGDFCRFCVVVNRAFHTLILHRNPTFVDKQPK
jgi:hypothetical protein